MVLRKGERSWNHYGQPRCEVDRSCWGREMADSGQDGPNMGEFGLEKWGLRPDLVDGCSRSGYRLVELVEMKTRVFESKKA